MNNQSYKANEDSKEIVSQDVSIDDDSTKTHVAQGTGKEVAIQTNPHEIERSLGQLPLRKRFVPLKFSDYCIFANNVKEEDEEIDVVEDADFTPSENITKQISNSKDDTQKRTRGRPKKHRDASNSLTSNEIDGTRGETVKKNPITKVANGFRCGVCRRIFNLRGNAKSHLITHTEDRPYQCDFTGCGKNLRTKESLRRHRLSHLGIKMFECPECNKKFSCNLSLQEHMNLHTGEKPLTCDICQAKFRQIAVLKRHMTTHSTHKPYACEVCGKKFSLKVYVRSHMKSHTGERPFACDICNKCFAHASDLNRHKIIHSGQKPYACSRCPMRYSDSSSRRRHEREHESKPQYVCHLCKQQFPRAGQLRVHLVKEHPCATTTTITSTDGANQIQEDPSHRSRMVTLQPGLVQTSVSSASSTSTNGGGRTVSLVQKVDPATVQMVLDPSCVGQMDNEGKAVVQGSLQADMPNVQQSHLQAVVMEIPRDGGEFSGIPSSGTTYKIIDNNNGDQVFEIQVEKEPQVPFHVQDLSSGMKINMSDIKISDGRLVAFIQNADSATVMEQATETATDQSDNHHVLDLPIESNGNESHNVVSNVLEGRHSVQNISGIAGSEEKGTPAFDSTAVRLEQEHITTVSADENVNSNHHKSLEHKNYPDNEKSNYVINIIENQNLQSEISHHNPHAEVMSQVISVPTAISSHFVDNPDLSSQDYYNWLSIFSEECKHFALPLSKDIFQKISQVQKTLSDFMAMPTGVITDKNNFKILMSITQDLSQITSSHLSLMFSNLNK